MTTRQLNRLRAKARRGHWDDRMLMGHPDVDPSLHPIIMEALGHYRLIVTSTADGVHAPGSFHYRRRAVDFGVVRSLVGRIIARLRLTRFQRHLHRKHGKKLTELFGPSNRANRKWGRPLVMAEGSALEELHDDHVHVAI